MSGCVTSTVNQTTNGREALTAIQQQIVEGNKALTEGVTWQAIENYDEAIRLCEEHYKDSKAKIYTCLLYTSPSPRDQRGSRMPSSA